MKIPVVYLAHKIRDSRGLWYHYEHIREAEKLAVKLWQIGFAVICPGKNNENFDGSMADDLILQGDLAIVEKCDAVIMHPNWKTSVGARGEREFAKKKGIPVFEWPKDEKKIRRMLKKNVSR